MEAIEPAEQNQVTYRPPFDTGKALKLRLQNNMSYDNIAKQMDCSKHTVWKHIRPFITLMKQHTALTAFEENRAKLLSAAELQLLGKLVTPGRLKAASVNNIAYALSQVHSMRRLEEDKSTSNNAVIYMDNEAKIEEIDAKLEALEADSRNAGGSD
jgi:predicted DNA-binding protein (UPF0251 family)